MPESRTRKSARNAVVALGAQLVLLVLGMATRAVFLRSLSIDFVGLDAFFVSLLGVLALADAGLGASIIFAMFGPLRNGDEEKLAALVAFCRTMYRIVAAVVLVLGLCLIPFLESMTGTSQGSRGIRLYFLVLLLSVSTNYLLTHRATLIEADQRLYIIKLVGLAFNGGRLMLQIAALLLLHSYLIYVLIQATFTVLNALAVHVTVGRLYPYLKRGANPLPREERTTLFAGLRAMAMFRASGVVLHNTDPLIAVSFLGVAVGGMYANYMLIVGSVLILLDAVFSSLTASVGHLVTGGDAPTRRDVFAELRLLAGFVYGLASVGLMVGLSDLIAVWLGEQYALAPIVVAGIVLNFYLQGVMAPVFAFRQATGLFRDVRYLIVAAAAVNLALSLLLVRTFGLPGIIYATVLARLATYVWAESLMLHRRHLGGGSWKHFAHVAGLFGASLASFGGASLMLRAVSPSGVAGVLWDGLAALISTTIIFWFLYRRTHAFRSLSQRISLLVRAGTMNSVHSGSEK